MVITGKTFGSGNRRYGFLGVGSKADAYDGTKDSGNYFAGTMDDVRIYSRALSNTEIMQLSFFGPANDVCVLVQYVLALPVVFALHRILGRQAPGRSLVAGWVAVLALVLIASFAGGCASTPENTRKQVVLQISDDNVKNWQTAFNVVNNLTNTFGKGNVDIEVIAFGDGIHALTFDSKAASRIPGAVSRGAHVIACENSMRRFKLSKQDMAPEVGYVRTGVQRIIERQQQGWTVIRP